MLIALLVWLYLLPLACVYGRATLNGLVSFAQVGPGRDAGLPVATLVGFGVLSVLTGTLGLFGPIAGLSHLLLGTGAAALAWRDRAALATAVRHVAARWRTLPWLPRALAVSLCVVVLWCSAGAATFSDTGLYHAQSIRWRQQFGVVPGLANLHPPLALTYPWFALSAFADASGLGLMRTHAHTGAVFLVFVFLALDVLRESAGDRPASTFVALGCAVFGLHVFGNWLSSPTPDVAATVSVWLVGLLLLDAVECHGRVLPDARGFAAVLLCWIAVTFKLAYVPLLLVPLALALCWRRTAPRASVAVLVVGVVVLVPFVAQTVIETGYLVHPLPALDLLARDWKMPLPWVVEQRDWVRSWSRVPGQWPHVVLKLPAREWVPIWWRDMPGSFRVLLAASVLPLPFYAAWWLRKSRVRTLAPQAAILCLWCLGLAFWFWAAPDPRYALGFFVFQALLLAAWPASRLLSRLGPNAWAAAWLVALAVQLPGLTLRTRLEGHRVLDRLVRPERDLVPKVSLVQGRGFAAFKPVESKRCWYASFPCAPQNIARVEARGPSLASGFRALP